MVSSVDLIQGFISLPLFLIVTAAAATAAAAVHVP